ncbi:MAG: HAD-IIA family hydrolase [Bacteroidales bacterium]|nr:HAD-IIA family hydrolase [Bacteroidales bacterium]
MNNLNNIELFLLDMDGTIYIENSLIDGANDFFNYLNKNKKKFIFLTNNSSNSAKNYLLKLQKLGIPCNLDNIFTSGMAMGIFLQKERTGIPVFLVGTQALYEELKDYNVNLVSNYKEAKIVVVGFDKELTYQKIEKACELIDHGAEFLATNVDMLCPIENKRFIPDCGSICKIIEIATRKKPKFLGKPERQMIDLIAHKNNCPPNKIAIIGDRLYTDVLTGINAGITSICVLSGETNIKMIKKSKYKPDYIFKNIKEIFEFLSQCQKH